MKYEILPQDKWDEIKPLFEGQPMPLPNHAAIAVARDEEGKVQGLLVLQLQLHLEPLILKSTGVNFTRLVDTLEEPLRVNGGHYWAFAPNALIGRMAETVGMQQMPWFVYHKEV